jgi:hypothetical protein
VNRRAACENLPAARLSIIRATITQGLRFRAGPPCRARWQKLLRMGIRGAATVHPKDKSFLVLFFKKEHFLP